MHSHKSFGLDNTPRPFFALHLGFAGGRDGKRGSSIPVHNTKLSKITGS